jgi:D-alanine-D-alanine ligase
MDVAVIFGGRSGEHEISLLSARSIINALDPDKYRLIEIGITHEGQWYAGEDALERFSAGDVSGLDPVSLPPEPGDRTLYAWHADGSHWEYAELDILFPVLHGTYGEDGTLQGLLEMADIPYVGAGVLASAVGMDKALFKRLMSAHNLPVLPAVLILSSVIHASMERAVEAAERLGSYPYFVKPANLGSSVGVSKCRNRSDLIEGLLDAARYDRRVIAEVGVRAREIEVSVLGNESVEASIAGEIVPSDEFYSYRAKYIDDASELLIPAPIPEEIAEEARRLAIKAFEAIDGAGLARVDFLLDRDTDRLYLNELNTMPGFTRISMYPKLWEASGLPYPALVDRLIELGWARFEQKDQLERRYRA